MYFDTPSVTSTLTGVAEWFNPIFSNFWVWGLIAIGVSLAFGMIGWIVHQFRKATTH